MYEKTVLTKSPFSLFNIFGNSNFPNIFLSEYISASLPLEKYILSNEHDFFKVGVKTSSIEKSPDFLIIILFPGSSSLTSSKLTLKTV